jgi:hypothetical protein
MKPGGIGRLMVLAFFYWGQPVERPPLEDHLALTVVPLYARVPAETAGQPREGKKRMLVCELRC